MKKTQSGFTLIELVVVIVLLGILGVTALGKFENLSADAADAAEKGIAGELSSAAAINYAARTVNSSNGVAIAKANCDATTNASAGTAKNPSSELDSLMASGSAPAGTIEYAFISGGTFGSGSGSAGGDCASGKTFACSITDTRGDDTKNGTAIILCTG
jgi:prepilin-type N-terminal cleavage/methylation domain-containing protein